MHRPMPLPSSSAITPSDDLVTDAPRGRGRPPSLSEDEIVRVALRLTREVGLQNLSMRALAREMDVPPMTIYHYVTSKESLHALVVDHILRDIAVPEGDDASWEERLMRLLADARRVFADHPGVSSRLGDPGTTEGTRLAEGVLAMLSDGGFASDAAVVCLCDALHLHDRADRHRRGWPMRSQAAPPSTLEGVTGSTRFSRDELFRTRLRCSHPRDSKASVILAPAHQCDALTTGSEEACVPCLLSDDSNWRVTFHAETPGRPDAPLGLP